MSGRAPGAGGAAACEGMLAELRKKHEVTSSQPLPARSTVGIVLEGVVVNIIVPGSPSYKRNEAGECIEPGDTVVAIDGAEVTKADIIPKLRGNDVPGSLVSISVLKQGREAPVDFRLTRADMRSVMNLKDLYLALGELHTEMDNPRPDKLRQKIDVLEKRVQAVTNYNDLQEEHMQGHISELEQSVRSLFAQAEQASADKVALDKTSKDLEGLKAQHVALLEECDKLKQKLQAATKDAQDGSQKAASMSVVNMFRGAVASAKQKDAEKRADSAESAAQEASNTADKASQDLHLANEQLQKASRAAEQANKEVERAKGELQRVTEDAEKVRKEAEEMRARAAQELQQAREESERLRKEAAQLRDTAGSASSRAEDAGTQLKKMDQECEMLRQEVSQFRMDANATKSRAEAAEKQLQQAEKDLKAAKEKVQQAERDLDRVRSTGEELKKEVADLKGQQKTGEQRVKDLTNERDDLKRKILDADASQEGGKKELQAAKQQIQDLQGACDRLGAELKSARESEKLASAKLETSSRKVEESSKAVEDLRMQLNPLQATEKKLIAQVSAEKSKAQEFERKMNDLQNIADQKTKDSATAEKRMDELKKVAEQKTQEAAEAEAGAKGLKRQVEQAQLQIARLEKDMQSITSSSSAEHEKSEAALVECTKLRNELREKEAEISSLDFKRDQAEQRTATVEQEMRDTSTRLRTAQKELEDTRKEMRALSEEAARGRILVEEMGKALANKDAQIAAQIKVLRNEKEELHKVAYSLREERRATRSELMKQKSELDTFRAFSAAAKEAVADEKVDIRGERRVLMLEKALEKSEIDRAALEKQVRELLGAAAPKQREVTDETRPEMGSLPIFNTRTDDIHTTAMAGLGCFVVAAGIGYLQRLLGVGGGIGGALMVMSGLAGFVLFVVCLFKFFLYLFGANSEEVLQQRGNYLPINSEPMPVPDKTRKVTPAAYYPAALDAIPRPDPATLQFLTTGRTKVDEQPYQGVAMQSQGRAVSPRDLSPRGQGIAGWSALDIQRAKGASGRSRGSRPLDFV